MPERQPDDVQILPLLGKFWTIANMLSLARLILVVPITYLIWTGGSLAWIFGLILVAAATDWFDGRIARWSHTVSDWGKVLDPLADKAAAAMIVMALVARPGPYTLPLWLLVLILVRDTLIVLGGVVLARRTGHVVMSAWIGKVAVTAVAVTVIAALLEADAPVLQACAWIAAALLVYSFGFYAIRFTRLLRGKGLPREVVQPAAVDSVHESVG